MDTFLVGITESNVIHIFKILIYSANDTSTYILTMDVSPKNLTNTSTIHFSNFC